MLEIKDLTITYGEGPAAVHALGPFSLHLEAGDICGIIGPSGCGKSTLLHALTGVVRPGGGSILLRGEPVNPARHSIGFIPQDFGLLPWRTVKQNCLLPFLIRKKALTADVLERFAGLAARLGIEGLLERYPRELSGGQRQRAAILRAFLMEPDLLLMDEPFSALDALTREEAQELFLHLWGRQRVTTVFVTHSIEEAVMMGRRIVVMSHGPGRVAETVENPHFGADGMRTSSGFHEMTDSIRGIVNEVWRR